MRIFVTGATGFVGSAIVQELIAAGHKVVGLARSDTSAKALIAAGIEVHQGDLTDFKSLEQGASKSDGVIHAGFIHDFSKFKDNCELDRKVIQTIGATLEGTDRPFIVTSAIGVLPVCKVVGEDTRPLKPSPNPRAASEEAVSNVLERGVNVSVVRLPPSTHGIGDHNFVPTLFKIARDKGVSAYVGDGQNSWPAVHRFDAAKVYRLAFEKGNTLGGYCFHAVAEEGIPFKHIAEVIGQILEIPIVCKSVQEATAHFGWFTHFASMSVKASSLKTQKVLGWQPTQPSLLEDLIQPSYFDNVRRNK